MQSFLGIVATLQLISKTKRLLDIEAAITCFTFMFI